MTAVTEADIAEWRQHVGRTEIRRQLLDTASLRRFAAATGAERDVMTAPPPLALWAWFAGAVSDGELGPDGHPKRGGFIPPITLPRRMFAAASFRFEAPLLLDREAELEVRIADLDHKRGRSGDLVFVVVDRTVRQEGEVRIAERQTLVYRGAGAPVPLPVPADDAESGDVWRPEAVHLFRFSAVTFNSHRIHYDLPYATVVEDYPGLVVQGPFAAAKLAMLAARDGPLATFAFRAEAPLFAGQPVRLERTGPGGLCALRCDGAIAVSATASWR
ncbi:MaoC family dehydratase N-terminal domain-containing protein [Sphingosinicella sp. LHD-64]|uniref:FAS1-like dehydratase domain-containing protein n=1 Tax=Sphingosinicella sp. LHD-64 TaxID=3072139 RepID=UPI00280E75BA|nr:MaoC family dehydratase N-terminal domain-containing protein [Sphingosinicella sp. LHD-64]MDQ8757600.1 MaoC family dehydratase N-terminal domain-containing protein [Sphingosinicella sp. LHD-64]